MSIRLNNTNQTRITFYSNNNKLIGYLLYKPLNNTIEHIRLQKTDIIIESYHIWSNNPNWFVYYFKLLQKSKYKIWELNIHFWKTIIIKAKFPNNIIVKFTDIAPKNKIYIIKKK